MAAYDSDDQALGALLSAGKSEDWETCADALNHLLKDRLGGKTLDQFTPMNKLEAESLLVVLGNAGLHAAPQGNPLRTLHDHVAAAAGGGADVDDAFQEIMDL